MPPVAGNEAGVASKDLRSSVLCLFDVDGTLTKPRNLVEADMTEKLEQLSKIVSIGLVGGSDLGKISEQMGCSPEELKVKFDYIFAENGLVSFQRIQTEEGPQSVSLSDQTMLSHLGEDYMQTLINSILKLLSSIRLPKKRGNFVEFRRGLLNVSPIGRSCSQEDRNEFVAYEEQHSVRRDIIDTLRRQFGDDELQFSIGGQISIDIFPRGWNKTYALGLLAGKFDVIHFFGDKTEPGGNDYEIFLDEMTVGHAVTSPKATIDLLNSLFNLNS